MDAINHLSFGLTWLILASVGGLIALIEWARRRQR